MAKSNNDPTRENDYLEQLQWQANHRRSVPIRFEPKWKYKIVYRYPQTTLTGRVLQFLGLIGAILVAIALVSSILTNPQLELPGKIFFCFMIGFIITIIFFAIRAGSKDQED